MTKWMRRHKILTAVLAFFLLGIIASLTTTPASKVASTAAVVTSPAAPSVTPAAATHSSKVTSAVTSSVTPISTPADATGAESALALKCQAMNTGNEPDILVRTKNPGLDWTAERLGGGNVWNWHSGTCQTGPEWAMATISTGAGHCGEVAMANDNPTYDETQVPARPLRKVIDRQGAC